MKQLSAGSAKGQDPGQRVDMQLLYFGLSVSHLISVTGKLDINLRIDIWAITKTPKVILKMISEMISK